MCPSIPNLQPVYFDFGLWPNKHLELLNSCDVELYAGERTGWRLMCPHWAEIDGCVHIGQRLKAVSTFGRDCREWLEGATNDEILTLVEETQ